MKKFTQQFFLRGLLSMGFGPIILAIIYGILGATGTVMTLTTAEVCQGILTITLMAFIAAGITAIYQTEKLPLPFAILIHAGVLYADYAFIYLFNNWIPKNPTAFSIFTASFVAGFALIWLIIYLFNAKSIRQINIKRT